MPKLTIAKKLRDHLYHEVNGKVVRKHKRFIVLLGGRASTKSQTAHDIALMDAQTQGIKTACFREFQNSIDDSSHALLSGEIERMGLQGFEVQNNKILVTHGGEKIEAFKFRGMARNPEGIKSMYGFQRAIVDEAQTISYKSLRALTPTFRDEQTEIWMLANPRSRADPFSQRFIIPFEKDLLRDGYYEDDMHLVIVINYTDSPFFPSTLEGERAHDEATMSTAEYRHIWLGEFYDEVAGSIIPVEWFDAAIDAHLKLGFNPEGAKFAAFDPSDEGKDAAGYSLRHGSVYLDICDTDQGDINDKLDWAVEKALNAGADHFTWDIGGMGTGLKRDVDRLLKDTHTEYHLFNGAETADNPDAIYQPVDSSDKTKNRTNKETFANRRASRYFSLADRFEKTYRAIKALESGAVPMNLNSDDMISLSSDIKQMDEIRSEVCRIPKRRNTNRKQIMTKAEMRALEIPSPNMADPMMMNEFSPAKKKTRPKHVQMNFSQRM